MPSRSSKARGFCGRRNPDDCAWHWHNLAIFTVVNALLLRPLPYAPRAARHGLAGPPCAGGPPDEWATPGIMPTGAAKLASLTDRGADRLATDIDVGR